MQKKKRYIEDYGLSSYDADILTSSRHLAKLFEEVLLEYPNPKIVANWLMGDYLRLLKDREISIEAAPVPPDALSRLLTLVDKGVISGTIAKTVFEEMFDTGKCPEVIIEQKELKQINDAVEIERIVEEVLSQNTKSVEDFKEGKTKALGFLIGQAMRTTRGKANPQLLNDVLIRRLEALKRSHMRV